MPCDTIQTSSIEFRPENTDFFKRALKALGYEVEEQDGRIHGFKSWSEEVTLENGRLEVSSRTSIDANVFKRAYSREIITSAAQEFGWDLQQSSENEFSVQKAAF